LGFLKREWRMETERERELRKRRKRGRVERGTMETKKP